jgi:hypothetical protein
MEDVEWQGHKMTVCEPQIFYPCSPYITADDILCKCSAVDLMFLPTLSYSTIWQLLRRKTFLLALAASTPDAAKSLSCLAEKMREPSVRRNVRTVRE